MRVEPTTDKTVILGCGYLGSALGPALIEAGHDCVATTTSSERVESLRRWGARPVILRLCDTAGLHQVLLDRRTVFLTVAPGRSQAAYATVYLDGARSLLEAVAGTAVRHIVYTSSTAVYGQQDGGWVDEGSPTVPSSDNARVLIETETCLTAGASQHGITVTILRLGGLYGPGRDPERRAVRYAGGERCDGDQYINLIHRQDAVAAMMALLEQPYGGVLNLTDDGPTTRRAYYDHLIAKAGLPPVRWISPDGPPQRGKRVRNGRIKRVLGLRLTHPTHM